MIFNMKNVTTETIFTILEYFTHFWAPHGSKGAQNGVNVPISSQIDIETCKFGLICYSTWGDGDFDVSVGKFKTYFEMTPYRHPYVRL